MPAIFPRLCTGVCAAVLLGGTARAQGTTAAASTQDCSDAHSSPIASTATCTPPPSNGLIIGSGASATYTASSAGGDVFGTQVTLRSDDFAGAGGGTFDFLTFSGATPPAQVFVYFLANVDASAESGNDNTRASGDGEVDVTYGGVAASLRRTVTDFFGTAPMITDTHSSNLTLDGGIWRGAFDYAGPGGAFDTNVGVFGELLSLGGDTPLAGAGSGRAQFQLLGFSVSDAAGNAIADASCSFQSQTPCTIINVAVTPAPEPSTIALFAAGLAGMLGARRGGRRRKL